VPEGIPNDCGMTLLSACRGHLTSALMRDAFRDLVPANGPALIDPPRQREQVPLVFGFPPSPRSNQELPVWTVPTLAPPVHPSKLIDCHMGCDERALPTRLSECEPVGSLDVSPVPRFSPAAMALEALPG
jgi:hypothetical protein